MKTKKQVLDHLMTTGYSPSAITKIMGFLIGNGTKTITEGVRYIRGNGTFAEFMEWYQKDEEPKPTVEATDNCPVCNMFERVISALNIASENGDDEVVAELEEVIDIMVDLFIVDETENDGNE